MVYRYLIKAAMRMRTYTLRMLIRIFGSYR